ncbi:demethylase and lysyl-hydroxylase [Seminavis robusta]|uniref:Demethylase and lysyl-hydroxylase n=1 Tax=Seminavis robusta TaxID=568900 RepID=A0A9N8F6A4_9STRA|nr:demethylase and lysyl-hydroxylase [Seminavis robusta]|eukprot:Sro4142_g353150.1 demethylase and lysyl-hydroxylase (236) ;mRNA; f:27-734
MMSLATYAKYVASEGLTDDSPLAVYDSEFGEDNSPMHELLADYTVPPCFSDDLFGLAVEEDDDDEDDDDYNHANSRPPWRWILAGPPRSGTGLHIDPLWTNAWVTLLQGLKRWILIPPHVELPKGAGLREPQVPSVIWFRDYYDKVQQLEGVVEILQNPGETVFVPNGWPHLVLNLEQTVAVTHNYASEFGPFERMWDETVQNEPEFAHRWYKGLCRHRPDLASRIQRNNNSSEA